MVATFELLSVYFNSFHRSRLWDNTIVCNPNRKHIQVWIQCLHPPNQKTNCQGCQCCDWTHPEKTKNLFKCNYSEKSTQIVWYQN